jgi:hypothetical protein
MLPGMVLQYDLPKDDKKFKPAGLEFSGDHYFSDGTSAAFNLNTKEQSLGLCISGKKAASPAPKDAPKGQNGQGFGAVPWLYLEEKSGNTGAKTVYRLNTAGGSPPPTCEGIGKTFEIEYATEYWFYQ